MFAGSLLLFFLFAYIDEYENFFLNKGSQNLVKADPYEIEAILKKYAKYVDEAHVNPVPEIFKEIPASDELREELRQEIEFLKNDGRMLVQTIKNLWVQDVDQVGPEEVRVNTREIVGGRYVDYETRRTIKRMPDAVFQMSYLFEHKKDAWIVTGYEEMGIQKMKSEP